MRSLRNIYSWLFAFTSLICLRIAFTFTLRTISQENTAGPYLLIGAALLLVFGFVFAMAWWTVFKLKPSARWWGIAASLINIQVSLFPLAVPPHSIDTGFLLILGLGLGGLVVFWRRVETPYAVFRPPLTLPGDGTIEILNKTAQPLSFAACLFAYHLWLGWVKDRDIPVAENGWYQTFICLFIGLLIAVLHELGHAIAGLSLGMKLRAFVIGPFQWYVCDGKWEFEFNPKDIFGVGKVGAFPRRVNFPRWAQLSVAAAGVFVNLVTGTIALWAGFSVYPDSPNGALLILFGLWSLILGGMNFAPFRIGSNYSDGAQILQMLSNGVWADLHRVFSVAGSTLVTPLRPKDYDIDAILRAGRTINQGTQGLLLRLLAYSYYLDLGKNLEAAGALSEAGSIYNESASDVSAETLTAFVFGGAYLWRDANMTHSWWEHLEAKKPTRFNVGYWLAKSALHWSEGRLQDANQSWEKADALAQQLPRAGAYDFDRHCCSLLRHALDDVSVST